MGILEAVLLGIVEGITEFLPVSSTGHLTIVEKLLGLPIDSVAVTAFTAFIQVGAIAAVLVYFREDIWRLLTAWLRGLAKPAERKAPEYRLAWGVIIGTIPIAIIGLLFKDQIETNLRSLWIVAAALIAWSGVMFIADRVSARRPETDVRLKDALIIGIVQCLALFPGVSRSGATISAGLLRGIDRVAATRLSFFLAIPALLAAGLLEAATAAGDISAHVGWGPTILATAVSFVVAYAAIAWLLRFVANHNFTAFIVYRIGLGVVLALLLLTGVISAT